MSKYLKESITIAKENSLFFLVESKAGKDLFRELRIPSNLVYDDTEEFYSWSSGKISINPDLMKLEGYADFILENKGNYISEDDFYSKFVTPNLGKRDIHVWTNKPGLYGLTKEVRNYYFPSKVTDLSIYKNGKIFHLGNFSKNIEG